MDEFEREFSEWLTEAVTVQRYAGAGPKGPVFDDLVTIAPAPGVPGVMVKDSNRLVRGTDSNARVSDASLVIPLRYAAHFAPESAVTLSDGRRRVVLSRSTDAEGLPLAHCRVVLT